MMIPTSALLATLLLTSLNVASGHVCMLYPRQRGNLSVIVPGDPSCYRRTMAACEGLPPSVPGTPFLRGEKTSVLVHQNLNHWVAPAADRTSGYFTLKLVGASAGTDVLLDTWSDFPAWDEVSQTNFTREITIPSGTSLGPHLLAFAYVSYNKDEVDPPSNTDAVFYNCADIDVVSNDRGQTAVNHPGTTTTATTTTATNTSAAAATSAATLATTTTPTYTCTTPDLWTARGVETTSTGGFLQHVLAVDNVQQQVYWSRQSSDPGVASFPSVTTITNFTSGREYVVTENGGKCAIYGPDQFYRLSFGGAAMGMTGGTGIGKGVYGFHGWVPCAVTCSRVGAVCCNVVSDVCGCVSLCAVFRVV
jgi:hypothetical protein